MTISSLFRCTLYKQALLGELIRICSATRKTCYLLECLAPSAQNPNDRSKNASATIGVCGRYFSFFLPSRVSCVGLQTPNSACCPGDVRSLLCLFSFFVFLQREEERLFEPQGGETPIWNRRGCSSEILNLTPKGDHLGVA